jgi:feruloyl-CoA synthase
MSKTSGRHVEMASPRIERQELADGGFILSSCDPLKPYARNICEYLEHWANEAPDPLFLG